MVSSVTGHTSLCRTCGFGGGGGLLGCLRRSYKHHRTPQTLHMHIFDMRLLSKVHKAPTRGIAEESNHLCYDKL